MSLEQDEFLALAEVECHDVVVATIDLSFYCIRGIERSQFHLAKKQGMKVQLPVQMERKGSYLQYRYLAWYGMDRTGTGSVPYDTITWWSYQ